MSRHHGTEVLQTHVCVRRWIVYVRYAVHTLSSEQYDDDDIGHRRTLLPLWGNSPVMPKSFLVRYPFTFRRIKRL